jgi:HK97 family phage major capsid protein/HK97 family phage prohead protease
MEMLHKATAQAAGPNPFVFVMSDDTVDRQGDIIEPDGWQLGNFKRNPVALFAHDSKLPLGVWRNVQIKGGQLVGEIEFLPEGRSARVDEIRAFVESGMLRAVSVGFRPVPGAAEPIPGSARGGVRYKKAELLECSLVSIPANPNALAIAKSLHLSDDAQRLIFGKSADEIEPAGDRGSPGKTAVSTPPIRKVKKMANLAERVTDAQNTLVQLKDDLTEHLKQDGADDEVTVELSDQIEKQEATVNALRRAENALATKAADRQKNDDEPRRVFPTAAKKSEPKDLIVRAAVVKLLSHITKQSPLEVLQSRYGADESVKTMYDVVSKAASSPATTTTTGWALELVQTATLDLLDSLLPLSIYPGLRDRGGRFTFGQNGIVALPSRALTPTIAGSFVGQGAPIPVRQGAFTSTQLTPKKMGVITTFTREIAEHSTPSIEGVLRQAIQEDTAVSLDSVLIDAVAASAIRPAGLRNGVTGITPTAGGGFTAALADLKALLGALVTASLGNVRAPVWIMNPLQKLSLSLLQDASGYFPFKEEIARGTLLGYPVLTSATVTAGLVLLIDAADFFSATGDEPRFDVSDQATLHMEDTSPQQISTVGTPNVVAAPVRSMFQTDSIALRMLLDINWSMRRTGMVAFVSGATW